IARVDRPFSLGGTLWCTIAGNVFRCPGRSVDCFVPPLSHPRANGFMSKITPLLIASIVCYLASFTYAEEPASRDKLPAELKAWLGPQSWDHDSETPSLSLGEKGAFDDTHLLSPMV